MFSPLTKISVARKLLYRDDDDDVAIVATNFLTDEQLLNVMLRERFKEITADGKNDDTAADVVVRVDSYGISCTAGLLRHVYLHVNDVELHAGMTTDNSRQLIYSKRCHYGYGRSEGYMIMCHDCANCFLDDVRSKCERFFLPLVNCDTIVPVVMQTSLIWLALIGALIGGIVISTRTNNFFTFTLFVPLISLLITMLYNRFAVCDNDMNDTLLYRCVHTTSSFKTPVSLSPSFMLRPIDVTAIVTSEHSSLLQPF